MASVTGPLPGAPASCPYWVPSTRIRLVASSRTTSMSRSCNVRQRMSTASPCPGSLSRLNQTRGLSAYRSAVARHHVESSGNEASSAKDPGSTWWRLMITTRPAPVNSSTMPSRSSLTSHAASSASSHPPGRQVLRRTVLRPQSRTAPERPAVSSGQNDCGPRRLTPRATKGSPSGPTMVLPSTVNTSGLGGAGRGGGRGGRIGPGAAGVADATRPQPRRPPVPRAAAAEAGAVQPASVAASRPRRASTVADTSIEK